MDTVSSKKRKSAAPAKVSLREMQKELTRKIVTEAALRVFEERGYSATTMDDIAEEASLHRGTIYLHFSNKAEILLAAVREMTGLRPIHEALDEAEDRASLEQVFSNMYTFWAEQSVPTWIHIREAAVADQNINSWLMELTESYNRRTQEFLEHRGVDPDLARARAFLLQNMWSEFIYRLRDGGAALDHDATVTALADFYEAALRPAPKRAAGTARKTAAKRAPSSRRKGT